MNLYQIPANYTDAGKILGMIEIRNAVEAVLLGIPCIFLCAHYLPFDLTTNIIISIFVIVPIVGFALMGIADECLSRYLLMIIGWRRRRRSLSHRGIKEVRECRLKMLYSARTKLRR